MVWIWAPGIANVQKAVNDLHLPSTIRVSMRDIQGATEILSHLVLVLMLAVLLYLSYFCLNRNVRGAGCHIVIARTFYLGVSCRLLATARPSTFRPLWDDHGDTGSSLRTKSFSSMRIRSFRRAASPVGDAMRNPAGALASDRNDRLSDVAGMLPLSFAIGAGSQMLQPRPIGSNRRSAEFRWFCPDHHPAVHYSLDAE